MNLSDMPQPERTPYITKYRDYLEGNLSPVAKNWDIRTAILRKKKAKGLVQSDHHFPIADQEKIEDSINRHRDADFFIANADVMDAYELSSFTKSGAIPFEYEVDEVLRFFEYLSDTFPWVEVLGANHEKRVATQIEKNLHPSLHFLCRSDILTLLASPFDNILVHEDLWFFQFGSALFAHPSKASQVEMRAGMQVYEHFKEWSPAYELDDWNALFVAHTHMQGVSYGSKAIVLETGCLCKTAAYALSPKIPYKHPASVGYATTIMNEGVADINETRLYHFPQEGVL